MLHISAEHSIHQGNLGEKACGWELQSSNSIQFSTGNAIYVAAGK